MSVLHEIVIREALTFFGAAVGLFWGYVLGVRVERRRWLRSLLPVLEAVVASARQMESNVRQLVKSA